MIIYIHGFNSSPASFKAKCLHDRFAAFRRAHEFVAPALPPSPAAAAQLLETLAREHPEAVLVNPAVRPYDLLAGEVGRQTNFHTGEEYNFTLEHVAELRELEVDAIDPRRYLLMVETGDEVLDYRDAVERYRGAQQLVIKGGDHGFSDFADYLDEVMEFCAAPAG